jgi:uncharacterized membrane protein
MTISDLFVYIGDMPAWTLLLGLFAYAFVCRYMELS